MRQYQWKSLDNLIRKEYHNMTGIVIAQGERCLYEQYYQGYRREDNVHVASVTKSILSMLIGIAIDQGAIIDVRQKVLDFFPEYVVKRREKRIYEVTIYDLLTMTAPYKYQYEPYTKVYSSEDWTKAALDLLGGKKEVGTFKYSTVGVQILSGILEQATGMSVVDFAWKFLFQPLDIQRPARRYIYTKEEHIDFLKNKHVDEWVVDPQGINTAGWGLTLKPVDMLKLGQLYLNQGIWKGKRLISQAWIEESTRQHSSWGELAYGYLWWVFDQENSPAYAAIGDGGNVIYICPRTSVVVAIASSFMPRAKDRIELIQKEIIPFLS